MTTPLQHQLTKLSVDRDQLIRLGLEPVRASELLAGADATIDEIRLLSRELRIPARSLLTLSGNRNTKNVQLRLNVRNLSDVVIEDEIDDLVVRSDLLSELLQGRKRKQVRVERPEKTYMNAERLAYLCREDFFNADDVEPLIDLEALIVRHLGIYVLISNNRKIEGATLSRRGIDFIFVADRPDPRMRFTLAHELCHSLVDLGVQQDEAWVDDEVQDGSRSKDVDEKFANAFASALLLPSAGIGIALKRFRERTGIDQDDITDVEIAFVSRVFGVSFQVAGRRFEDLKLIPRGSGQSLYEAVAKQFGSPEKFSDAVGLPPRASASWGFGIRATVLSLRRSLQEGELSIGRLAELTNLRVDQIGQMIHS